MDLAKVLQQLHDELENLDAAILSLERLQEAGKHRDDKDPEWLREVTKPVRRARKRKSTIDDPKTQPGIGAPSEPE